jgi:hypothetical protein
MVTTPYPPALELQANAPGLWDQDAADLRVVVGRCQRAGAVVSVDYVPGWSLSGANTNNRTLRLVNRGPSGAGSTVIATLALASGVNLTAYVAKAITVTAANAAVALGDVLEWQSVHAGTGLADPGGLVIVQMSAGS